MLQTGSYTENKPKYTKYIQNAGPDQRGDRLYVKRHRLFNRGVKRRRLYEGTSSPQGVELNSLAQETIASLIEGR